VKQASFLFTVH